MQLLGRAELITSRRGVGGGIKLARPPKKINLLEIIDAVDPLRRNSVAGPQRNLTALNQKLDAVLAQLQKGCAATSLAAVAAKSK